MSTYHCWEIKVLMTWLYPTVITIQRRPTIQVLQSDQKISKGVLRLDPKVKSIMYYQATRNRYYF